MEGYGDEANDSTIEIYTDFRDRIPEVHEGNPFYKKRGTGNGGSPAAQGPDRDAEISEALKRDDGVVCVL